jgi:hypothetical protein
MKDVLRCGITYLDGSSASCGGLRMLVCEVGMGCAFVSSLAAPTPSSALLSIIFHPSIL